jgi:2-polyprenyl-6-methoxyphenol hydroxylase-like FAD-dependent oxidoreductase
MTDKTPEASMAKDSNPQVLIAGAGPTGLAAALELSRFGVRTRIVEEMEGPGSTSRAIAVQARTLEELEIRGLADQFVELGHRAEGGDIYGDGKLLVHVDFTKIPSRYNFVLFLAQTETERILREALEAQGGAVEWGVKVTAIGLEPSSVTTVLEHADGSIEEVTAAYVIDAEGAHSVIRNTLGLQFKGKTLEETFVLGDVQVDGNLPNSSFHIFSSESGLLALFPFGGSQFRVVASNPPRDLAKAKMPTIEELQALCDQRSHFPIKLRDLTWSSIFHANSRMVGNLHVGRVFLAGDAAHIHSPAGGEGMNTGIQDAINLGWKLALVLEGNTSEKLLDTYDQDRIPVMRSILSRTEAMTNAMGGPSTLRSFFLHLAPWIANSEFAQEIATSRISQIQMNYRNSALSEDHFGDGSLTAGDRVPDITVRIPGKDAPKEATRLSTLLDASRFTLLLANFQNVEALETVRATLGKAASTWLELVDVAKVAAPDGDAGKPFADAFGVKPSITLIRPDAYVGFRGGESSAEDLIKYGDKWFTPAAQRQAA